MKATTLLTATCLLLGIGQQAFSKEYPMPAPGETYGFVDPDYPNYRAYVESYTPKDTIINSITYSRYLTRYDSRRVYYYDSYLKSEYLLYNFNLNSGDSVYLRGTCSNDSILFKVTGTSNLTMKNGEIRKYMTLETGKRETYDYLQLQWIEGIGDLTSGLFYCPGMNAETFGLICYCDASGLVYQKWAGVTCDNILQLYPTGVVESAKESIFAFIDNDRILHISSDQALRSVTLSDASGRTVRQDKGRSVSIGGVCAGIYILTATLEDGREYSSAVAVP